MHTPGPMDVQCGPDVGCRICHEPADATYVLCVQHQRLARLAPKLLEALEGLTPPNWSLNDPMRREYTLARQALAEAKGE